MKPYTLTQDTIYRALSLRCEPPEGLILNNSGHLVLKGCGDGVKVMPGDEIRCENGAYRAYPGVK